MRKTALLLASLVLLNITNVTAAEKYTFVPVNGVVELFTSQGCSSCPPADAYMGVVKQKYKDKLVLTYAVTIWDYLGWKDKFGTTKNTNRQRAYSRYMGLRSIYTPQSVVNGMVDAVGSDKRKIYSNLAKSHMKLKNVYVPMKVITDNMKLKIQIGDAPKDLLKLKKNPNDPLDATLWLVKYKDVAKVDIRAGENAGRAIEYHNIVGDFMPLGMWEGKAREFTISYRDLKGVVGDSKTDKFAFILQLEGVGPIVSAVKVN